MIIPTERNIGIVNQFENLVNARLVLDDLESIETTSFFV